LSYGFCFIGFLKARKAGFRGVFALWSPSEGDDGYQERPDVPAEDLRWRPLRFAELEKIQKNCILTSFSLSAKEEVVPGKRRIKIPEIVRDIRSRITDSELMEKYSLSAKGLEGLFKTILDAGIMQSSEIYGRLPSYDHSVDLEDLRSLPRRDLELRIHLFDQTQPQVRGLLSDLTEKGFRVREVEAKVAEVRTFVIPADELFPIDPIVLEARCRWVKKETGGSSVAGLK